MNFKGLFKKNKEPELTESEWNDWLIEHFTSVVRRDNQLMLEVKSLTPNKSRIMCEGEYMGGLVKLRVDKNSSEEAILNELNQVKEDIQMVNRIVTKFYQGRDVVFTGYRTLMDLSNTISFRVGAEDKEVNYRTYGDPLANVLKSFISKEMQQPNLKGTFKIGEKQFIALMNENKGKKIHIEIERK